MKRIFFLSLTFFFFCRSETDLLQLPSRYRSYGSYNGDTVANIGFPDCLDYIVEVDTPTIKYIPIDENVRRYLRRKYPEEKIETIAFPFETVFRLKEIRKSKTDKHKNRNGKYLNYTLNFDSSRKNSSKYETTAIKILRDIQQKPLWKSDDSEAYEKSLVKKYSPHGFSENGKLCHRPPSSTEFILGSNQFFVGEDCKSLEEEILFTEFLKEFVEFANRGHELSFHPDGKDFRFVTVNGNRCR